MKGMSFFKAKPAYDRLTVCILQEMYLLQQTFTC